MSPKLTRMTEGGATICGTCQKNGGELAKGFTLRMTKAMMPKGGGGSGDKGVSIDRKVQRVEQPGAIAPDDQCPGQEILDRTTRGSNSTE